MKRPRIVLVALTATLLGSGALRNWYYEAHREDGQRLVEVYQGIRVLVAVDPIHESSVREPITGLPPDPKLLAASLQSLHRELPRYPVGYLKELGLRRIVLCADLRHGDHRAGGMAAQTFGTIYYAVDAIGRSGVWGRHAIHHEVMHLIDARSMGRDVQWNALNPAGFQYSPEIAQGRRLAGFVSSYAMTNPREDRAEVYGYLMSSPNYLAWRCMRDKTLESKVATLDSMIRARGPLPEGWPDWRGLEAHWRKRTETW